MSATSSEGFPSVASTATDPAMSLTRSPLTSSKSRLVGASMVHCVIPPVLPVWPPVTPHDISHPPKVKTYRERPRAARAPTHTPPQVRIERDREPPSPCRL